MTATAVHKIGVLDGALVREAGPADAPVIVLLAGFADNGSMFLPLFATDLVRRYRLVAVDLPGFGASPRQPHLSTIADYGHWLAPVIEDAYPGWPVGLVGHSLASCIAVKAASELDRAAGIFSIEGNLTADDAYFSGKAADHDSAAAFKSVMLDLMWQRAAKTPVLRRYHGALEIADADAMWVLGRDARRISVDDAPGRALADAPSPKLYYWSRDNTPAASIAWLQADHVPHRHFEGASHWPTIDAPDATAAAIAEFFDPLLTGSDFPAPRSR